MRKARTESSAEIHYRVTNAYSCIKKRCPPFETKTALWGGFRVLCAPEALRPIRS